MCIVSVRARDGYCRHWCTHARVVVVHGCGETCLEAVVLRPVSVEVADPSVARVVRSVEGYLLPRKRVDERFCIGLHNLDQMAAPPRSRGRSLSDDLLGFVVAPVAAVVGAGGTNSHVAVDCIGSEFLQCLVKGRPSERPLVVASCFGESRALTPPPVARLRSLMLKVSSGIGTGRESLVQTKRCSVVASIAAWKQKTVGGQTAEVPYGMVRSSHRAKAMALLMVSALSFSSILVLRDLLTLSEVGLKSSISISSASRALSRPASKPFCTVPDSRRSVH